MNMFFTRKGPIVFLLICALFIQGVPCWSDGDDEPVPERVRISINKALRYLARTQEKDGSWPPIGRWGADGGHVFTTAMALLTLESTYRYP